MRTLLAVLLLLQCACAKNGNHASSNCANSVRDGGESDVDCGGSCDKCATGKHCGAGSDCAERVCTSGVCSQDCKDGVRNGTETDSDCGGSCSPCSAGQACVENSDCASASCVQSICAAMNPDTSIATVGAVCAQPSAITCAGHAQKIVLICDTTSQKWTPFQVCSGDELCDSSTGANHGSCQPLSAGCAGKPPGYVVCTDHTRFSCGPDLVTSYSEDCVSPEACAASSGITCAPCGNTFDCATYRGTQGHVYAAPRFVALGGKPPYAFVGDSLPSGITLTSAGAFVGVAEASATTSSVISVVDAHGACATMPWKLDVAAGAATCPAIVLSPAVLADAASAGYNQTVTAAGGAGPYTYGLVDGALPIGLALSSAGAITGTATTPGAYAFTVRAADAAGCEGLAHYEMKALKTTGCTVAVSTNYLPTTYLHSNYSTIIAGTGPAPLSFALASGAMPAGLTLLPDGRIYGSPTVTSSAGVQVIATDATFCRSSVKSLPFTVTSQICSPTIAVSTDTLPAAKYGEIYTQSLTATGGAAYAFSAVGALPAGLTLDGTTGAISGTPTAVGDSHFTIVVTATGGCADHRDYTLHVSGPASCAPGISLVLDAGECSSIGCDTVAGCGKHAVPAGLEMANPKLGDCSKVVCQAGALTPVLDTSEDCGPHTTCVAIDTCSGQLGAICGAVASCDSGKCVDGVCCNSDCNGLCQTCGETGSCHAVEGHQDDTCTSNQFCNAVSSCVVCGAVNEPCCDTTCNAGLACTSAGTCKAAGGTPCSAGDCAPGLNCVSSYVDSDSDGWGGGAAGVRCIDPSNHYGGGYADRAGDCCDSDYKANPDAQFFPYGNPPNAPDSCGSWDYNCNGSIQYQYPATSSEACALCSTAMDDVYFWEAGVYPTCGNADFLKHWYCTPSCQDGGEAHVFRAVSCE